MLELDVLLHWITIVKKLKLIPFLLVVVALVGCSINPKNDIKQTILNYNNNLPIALESLDDSVLKDFATEMEMNRVHLFYEQTAQQQKIIRSKLKNINFTKMEITGNEAKVTTNENWTFQLFDKNTHKPLGKEEPIKYNTVYSLIKNNDKWLIDNISFIEH